MHAHVSRYNSMSEGHFDCCRRRLAILLISLVLVIIICPQQYISLFSQYFKQFSISNQVSNIQYPSDSLISLFEFFNSPQLDSISQSSTILPIIVLSKASNVEIRDAIRRTWASEQFYQNNALIVKVFFLVGTDDYTMKRIYAEQTIFADIIHVSVPDLNSFIAYKELSAMIWVRTYLPNALFYIKTEDNAIINIKSVINRLLPVIESVMNDNIIIGWFGSDHYVQQSSYQKFIDVVIPPRLVDIYYAMSLLYIVTSRASDRMLETLNYIHTIEQPGDSFVTGFLRDAAHVQIRN